MFKPASSGAETARFRERLRSRPARPRRPLQPEYALIAPAEDFVPPGESAGVVLAFSPRLSNAQLEGD